MDRHTPLALAARTLLRERAEIFFTTLEEALLTFEVEAVHDLRVASRRLRAGLRLFSPCYPPKKIARLAREVRRLTREAGELRNIDEGLLFFQHAALEVEGVRGDLAHLMARDYRRRQQREQESIRPLLERCRDGGLGKRLRRCLSHPYLLHPPTGLPDPFTPLYRFAAEALAPPLEAVCELAQIARQQAATEAQHRLRIAVKSYRYRVELLAPAWEDPSGKILSVLKGYQEVLGKMHDLDVFALEVTTYEGHPGTTPLLEHLGGLRDEEFGRFEKMLSDTPFELLGSRIVEAL